jgi:hypothetical protein
MTMILFAEKPNAAVGYIHHIRKLNPEGGDLITIFAHNNHLLQPQFQFPHHLKVRNLPAVRPVAFKPLQLEGFLPPRRNVSTITMDEAVAAVSSAKTPLQLLYWFRRRARGKGRYVQSHDATRAMRNWQGTGKYPVSGISGTRFGLGAEEFQNYALHTLVDRGLVAEADSRFTLSEDGDAFLDVFHPDCEDADQPFRTAAWTCLPLEKAEEAIGRYIQTFFGKQRRFIGKLPHILLDGTIRYPAAGKEA